MASDAQKHESKLRKKVREIEKIELRMAAGEKLDVLQLKKVEAKSAVLDELECLLSGHGTFPVANSSAPSQTPSLTPPSRNSKIVYSKASSCAQCGEDGTMEGGWGAAGSPHQGQWFCAKCWSAWDDGVNLFAGGGSRLGGSKSNASATLDQKRAVAFAAAERRQHSIPGVSSDSVAELERQGRRQALAGQLTELLKQRGLEAPFCLGAASEQQLLEQLRRLRIGMEPAKKLLELDS